MCGITGFTGKRKDSTLSMMMDSLIHRGPDDSGCYSDDNVSLGMRRLSIIDLESGQQPIHNEDKTLWVVFNGEIYNYIELRKELELRGHTFYTGHSDTEIIVHAYEEWGLEFPHKLNGMFAIALWNCKKEELILIRDRMGVKPLFYLQVNGNIVFGSEIKSILLYPDYHKEMNLEAIYHYLSLRNIPAPMTAFKNIFTLRPAEMLVFSKGNLNKKLWWKLDFRANNELGTNYIKSHILELLEDAVKLRMRSDAPYGSYLSGGLDSSSVAAIMTKFSDKPVKTFCLGYEDEFKNKEADIHSARKLHKLFNTEHYEYIMTYNELIEDAEEIIKAFDQPFSGTASTYFLSKLIHKHVKVALSGDAADELFGSYKSHRLALPMSHFSNLYDKYKSKSLTEEELNLFKPFDTDFLEKLYDLSEGNQLDWRYSLYIFPDREKENLLTNNFVNQRKEFSTYSLLKSYFEDLTATDPLNRMLEMEAKTQLPDQVLAFVDFLSMAHSVEVRSPFLDYRLVEFAASIPGNIKIKNGVVKSALKESLAPLLPDSIIKRPKEGFVLPIYNWMEGKFKDFSCDILSPDRLKKFNLVKSSEVKLLLDAHFQNNANIPAQIWTLINLQIWCETYFG